MFVKVKWTHAFYLYFRTTHQYTGWSESQDSTMTKLQQQYWVTKQTVYRKLGKKEDECVIASDAELDAKLELFKSIQDSCSHLQRIIDRYQERLCCKSMCTNNGRSFYNYYCSLFLHKLGTW